MLDNPIRSYAGLKWNDLPFEDKDYIANLKGRGYDISGIARELGIAKNSLVREANEFLKFKSEFLAAHVTGLINKIPESPSPELTEYEILEGDDWIVVSDIEVPDHDIWMLQAALLTGMRHGIKRLIIDGDFLATDQDSLNSWVATWKQRSELRYEDAIDLAERILLSFLEWFEEIVIVEGNHDDRIARKTGGEVHLGMFLRLAGVRYSRYSYCYIKTNRNGGAEPFSGDMIKVMHQKPYSGSSAGLAQKIFDSDNGPYGDDPKDKVDCHIVIAHTHHAQRAWTKDGSREVIALGYMRDPNRTSYKQKNVTAHHKAISGFLMIKNGFFYPKFKYGTDWKEELGPEFYHALISANEKMPEAI